MLIAKYFLAAPWILRLLLFQAQRLREEVVGQGPHVGPLSVVRRPSVPALRVLPRQDSWRLLRSGLLQQGRHHLAKVARMDAVVPG